MHKKVLQQTSFVSFSRTCLQLSNLKWEILSTQYMTIGRNGARKSAMHYNAELLSVFTLRSSEPLFRADHAVPRLQNSPEVSTKDFVCKGFCEIPCTLVVCSEAPKRATSF